MPTGLPPDRLPSAKAQRLAKELADNPQSKVFVPLAEEYAKAGMLQRAAMLLEEGIQHYPGYVVAMVALGAVYFEMKELAAAKEVLEAAITSSPENMKAHRVLARLYAADGQTELARRSCTVVLMTNPLDEEINNLERTLGKSHEARERRSAPRVQIDPDPAADPQAAADRTETVIDESPATGHPTTQPPVTDSPSAETVPGVTTTPFREDLPRESPYAKPIARLEAWLSHIRTIRRTRA